VYLDVHVQDVAQLDDAEDQQQQQRQHKRKLDDALAAWSGGG
jgi:hypothetical protein